MPDADLNDLRPQLRVRAQAFFSACNDLILPIIYPGFRAKPLETLRTAAAQQADAASGASDVQVGWHNFGLAFDFGVFDVAGKYIEDGTHPAYMACGAVAQALGCHYPIVLKSGVFDYDHVEYHPGCTLAQMEAAEAVGDRLFA